MWQQERHCEQGYVIVQGKKVLFLKKVFCLRKGNRKTSGGRLEERSVPREGERAVVVEVT